MVRIRTLLSLITYLCIAVGYATVATYAEAPYVAGLAVSAGLSAWLDFTKPTRIPRWVLNCASIAVLVYSFSRINRDYLIEPILNALLLLIGIKLFEDKKFRDYMQIYAMCMFLLIGSSLISFSMVFIVYFLLLCALSTAALMLLAYFSHDGKMTISRDNLLRIAHQAFLICAVSIPASSLFFLILPRTNYPLFGFLNKLAIAKSGFSDRVALGEVSEIQEDSRVIFRAEMPKVPDDMLYWRGIELDRFDGTTWTAGSSPDDFPARPLQGEHIPQTIYLEPYGNKYLFALDRPVSMSTTGRRPRRLTSSVRYGNVFERIRYTAVSVPTSMLPQKPFDKSRYLQLPPGFSPRITALVRTVLARGGGDSVTALYDFIKSQPYKYSLKDLPASDTPLEDFLLTQRSGNCEYFASALAVMLRTAGIPARVVGGYRNGYYNDTGGYYLVLQKNAHVWVEAYRNGRGWIRLDPTPYVPDSPAGEYGRSIFLRLKLLADTLNYYWDKFILSYDFNRQLNILKKMAAIVERPPLVPKLAEMDWKHILPAAGIAFAGIGLLSLCFVPRKSPEAKLALRFLKKMAARGYGKKPSEGLDEFVSRIGEEPLRMKAHAFAEEFQGTFYRDGRFTNERLAVLRGLIRRI